METRFPIIRPGNFGNLVKTDERRYEFDAHNEALIFHQIPVDVVFIGDSITHMWDLQTYFGRSGLILVNRGAGGDRSYYTVRRFSADVLQLKPKCVVIHIGINNTWSLDEWIPSDRQTEEQIQRQVLADVAEMIFLSMENGIIPILCSILPTGMDANANTAVRNRLIVGMNGELQRIAAEKQISFVNYHQEFTAEDGETLNSQLSFDGLHPNVYGYNKMAEIIRHTLQTFHK
jgi:lysophospholipase L1-like esterase